MIRTSAWIIIISLMCYHKCIYAGWVKIAQDSESIESGTNSSFPLFTKSEIFSDYVKRDETKRFKIIKPTQPKSEPPRSVVFLDTTQLDFNIQKDDKTKKLSSKLDFVEQDESVQVESDSDDSQSSASVSDNTSLPTPSQPSVTKRNDRKKGTNKKHAHNVPSTKNPIENLVEFLKTVQQSLFAKTSYSISEKIKTLKTFRDNMLISIEKRIKSLWPTASTRPKRGLWNDEEGIDFPSAEASLMTINFLTFAVFLIKLVLQVINTIKSKHYNLSSLGTMEAIKIGRRKRDMEPTFEYESENDKYLNIMNIIDNFKPD